MKTNKFINSSTLFGLGYVKYAPGTVGSVLPLLFLFFEGYLFYISLIVVNACLLLTSYINITKMESQDINDPSFVVIDEFVGMSFVLSMPFLPKTIFWIVLTFAIFRFFDIYKPFPINLLNSKKGAFFVFADDIVAALFTIIIVYLSYLSSQVLAIIIL